MANPIEEYLQEYSEDKEKTAGVLPKPGWFGRQSEGTKQVLIAGGLFAGSTLAAEAYEGIRNAVTKATGYKRMVKHNPQLAKKDKKEVQTLYTTLHNISPDLAKDPVVANSWVNRMMYTDSYVDPKTISDLTSAQSKMQKRSPEMIQSFNRMVPSLAGSMAKDPDYFKKPTFKKPQNRISDKVAKPLIDDWINK
ncbi:MAG: hypothetical protein ACXAEU_17120 [Candidatus Hodarchaeales archaeon]|jgi:hypothetical protein